MHIDHIGIAVKDLETSVANWEKLLGASCYKREVVETQKVETAFFIKKESKIELLGPTSEDSVIAKYIEKRGEGMHHVAFEVEDIEAEIARLKNEGYTLLSDEPSNGADQKKIVFMHPKDANGVLVELCQSMQ